MPFDVPSEDGHLVIKTQAKMLIRWFGQWE